MWYLFRERAVARINEIPDKATIKVDKTPWEAVQRSRHGESLIAHPDTDGYRTLPDKGFEYASKLVDLPEWLYVQQKMPQSLIYVSSSCKWSNCFHWSTHRIKL